MNLKSVMIISSCELENSYQNILLSKNFHQTALTDIPDHL